MDVAVYVGVICTVAGCVGGLVASHVVIAFIRKAESAALDELKQAKAAVLTQAKAAEQEVKKVL